MACIEYLRLFLPPIYYKIKEKIFRKSLIESPLPQIEHHSDKLIIIGNGPSLNESVVRYKDVITKYDRICVNYFGSSDLYVDLKPNIYVFADPAFFQIPSNQKESIETLFDNIVYKTDWPLQIIVPYSVKDAPILNKFITNANIKIDFYYNGSQKTYKMSKFEIWDRNLIGPPAQNVLNVCVYLALFWNYHETFIIGADTSSLEDLRIDQKTNELYTVDKHFYKREDIYKDKSLFNEHNCRKLDGWKIHEYIYAIGRMLEGYYILAEYAKYKGLKVYNASEYSWINCFERKKIE